MTPEQSSKLREAFPPEAIGKLPKGGTQLDFVGHAAVTDRLLEIDPNWSWEPVAFAEDGGPLIRTVGQQYELWGRLTVCGVTRTEVGTCGVKDFEPSKQLVSDFVCRGAMRFGVALDLWTKGALESEVVSHAAVEDERKRLGRLIAEIKGVDGAADRLKEVWREANLPGLPAMTKPDDFAEVTEICHQVLQSV